MNDSETLKAVKEDPIYACVVLELNPSLSLRMTARFLSLGEQRGTVVLDIYTPKEEPQPQVRVALGLLKTKPWPLSPPW